MPLRFVEAFVGQIESAVETTITKKLKEEVLKLDSFLQSFPREIPVDDVASLNVTFINDPVLHNSSIALEMDGLFTPRDQFWKAKSYLEHLQTFLCDDSSKMIGISIDEAVFNSASTLYFEVSSSLDFVNVNYQLETCECMHGLLCQKMNYY